MTNKIPPVPPRKSSDSGIIRPPTPPGQMSVRMWLIGCILKNPEFLREFSDESLAAQKAVRIADNILRSMSSDKAPQIKQPTEDEMQRWDTFVKDHSNQAVQAEKRRNSDTIPAVPRKMTPSPESVQALAKITPTKVPSTQAMQIKELSQSARESFRKASEQINAVSARAATLPPPPPEAQAKKKLSSSRSCYSYVFSDSEE